MNNIQETDFKMRKRKYIKPEIEIESIAHEALMKTMSVATDDDPINPGESESKRHDPNEYHDYNEDLPWNSVWDED